MRNRSTDLIEWNDALSDGMGLSGSHYALTYDRSNEDLALIKRAERRWLIAVDGSMVCVAISFKTRSPVARDLKPYGASFRVGATESAMNIVVWPS
jgi:hypothetical protein